LQDWIHVQLSIIGKVIEIDCDGLFHCDVIELTTSICFKFKLFISLF
jgi:hypothetical protein